MEDHSQTLFVCSACQEASRIKSEVEAHIRDNAGEGTHPDPPIEGGVSSHIEGRTPTIDGYPFDEWDENIKDYLRNERVGLAGSEPQAPYVKVADQADVPKSYAAFALETIYDIEPVTAGGGVAKASTAWDDLTEKQRDILLATAFFDDLEPKDIVALDFTSVNTSAQVRDTERKYGWMLAHPEVETPIGPTEGDERAMADEAPSLGEPEPDTAEATDGGAEAQSQTDPGPSAGEIARQGADGVLISYDEAWDLITSRWDRGDVEGARDVFDRAVGVDDD